MEAGIIHKQDGVVVKNTFFHKEAVNKVLLSASENSFMPAELCVSPVKGGDGNTEYLALFSYRCDAEKAVPLSLQKIGSEHKFCYVLEINGGQAEKHGIVIGDEAVLHRSD